MLNSRQLTFVREIAGGKTLTDAYCSAYPGATREAARSAAPRLLKNPFVSEEIARLRADVRQNTVLSFQAKREFLAGVILSAADGLPKVSDQLRAVELDCKMASDFYSDRNENANNSFHFILNLTKLEAAQSDQPDAIDLTPAPDQRPLLEMAR